jgi:GMP synthase (glutamine-hydrolysing)
VKRVLVIQHESYEALGTWGPILKQRVKRTRFVNFERTPELEPSLDGYEGVILLGGYMGVYESDSYSHLKIELKLIEEALKRDLPILGICLGSQILATVLGAQVQRHTEREMGWYDIELTEAGRADPVVGHFKPREKVFQSHGDIFEIPKSAEHLMRSEICEGQAFRYGKKVYGIQFHLEVNLTIIDDWFEMPENRELFASGKFAPGEIRRDTSKYLERSMELSQETFRRFLDISGTEPKAIRLGSAPR